MKKETMTQYIADDGTPFNRQEDCEKYEQELALRQKRTTYWRVVTGADLTEGRGYYKLKLIECYGPEYESTAKMLMEDWCFRILGRKAVFVQGVAPMENWILSQISLKYFNQPNAKIQIGDYSYPAEKIKLIMGDRETGLVIKE